jgi:hypothetical protein
MTSFKQIEANRANARKNSHAAPARWCPVAQFSVLGASEGIGFVRSAFERIDRAWRL